MRKAALDGMSSIIILKSIELLISLVYMQGRGFCVSHHPVFNLASLMTTPLLLMAMTMKMILLIIHPREYMCQKVIFCTLCYKIIYY